MTKLNKCIDLVVPIPISVNHIYSRSKSGVFVNSKARAQIGSINYVIQQQIRKYDFQLPIEKDVVVNINFFPKNKRKRDIDNILKILLDCLQKCNIIKDDNLIVELNIKKHKIYEDKIELNIMWDHDE